MRNAERERASLQPGSRAGRPADIFTIWLPPASFLTSLYVEQKRTERSRRRLILMLLDWRNVLTSEAPSDAGVREGVLAAISRSIRETDIRGWFRSDEVIGVVFTEIEPAQAKTVGSVLDAKMRRALEQQFPSAQIRLESVSFHLYPEDWQEPADNGGPSVGERYPELIRNGRSSLALRAKRGVDVLGSLAALILFSPIMITLALFVRLSSKGPAIFKQQRIGQYGRVFTFLKFRSMYTGNDSRIHQDFVKSLIAGDSSRAVAPSTAVYKIQDDPRITPIGRFLRRTSLDELPQFINVLFGDMALVGPRPPVMYEVDNYDVWHRQRLMVKPGITGLWQVYGRSSVRFDDMVRLDLRYASSWSIWLDLKILMRTPRAVLKGSGAY